MRSEIVEELSLALQIDNGLMAQSVAVGEPISLSDIVELAATARALYDTVTLASRDFDRMEQCFELWQAASRTFSLLRAAWEMVPADGQLVGLHRAQLERLYELCEDRFALYTSNGPDRRRGA